ncbi:MAG: cell division protein CpoB [Nitrospirales bacterium]|nr:MAG: cell division protein CpoB [Nitrospirales bacterium]
MNRQLNTCIYQDLRILASALCVLLGLSGCAADLNLSDIKKQVEILETQQGDFKKREQQYINRIETLESQVDEHDFLVGELIKTEEEASVDTRNLLDKLERTSSSLREQIEQSRASAQRRDQDLSIRAKALESRIDNMLQQQRTVAAKPVTLPDKKKNSSNQQQPNQTKNHVNGQTKQGPNSQASVFRSAYKVYLNGQYERATVEFSRFLKQYPTAVLTPQAYYYLGDSHYIRKDYDAATQALQHLLREYPESKYVSIALLKLGLVKKENDQKSQAKELWSRVIREYPDSSEAALAKEQIEKVQ